MLHRLHCVTEAPNTSAVPRVSVCVSMCLHVPLRPSLTFPYTPTMQEWRGRTFSPRTSTSSRSLLLTRGGPFPLARPAAAPPPRRLCLGPRSCVRTGSIVGAYVLHKAARADFRSLVLFLARTQTLTLALSLCSRARTRYRSRFLSCALLPARSLSLSSLLALPFSLSLALSLFRWRPLIWSAGAGPLVERGCFQEC